MTKKIKVRTCMVCNEHEVSEEWNLYESCKLCFLHAMLAGHTHQKILPNTLCRVYWETCDEYGIAEMPKKVPNIDEYKANYKEGDNRKPRKYAGIGRLLK